MSEIYLIAPQDVQVRFILSPAHNVLASLILLASDVSSPNEWAQQTLADLTKEQFEFNEWTSPIAGMFLEQKEWPSFPTWVDHLETLDAREMRDQVVQKMLKKAAMHQEKKLDELPSVTELLRDQETFVSFFKQVHDCDKDFDQEQHEQEYTRLQDPVALQRAIVQHLRTMWDKYLATEWERNVPMLRESIAAFESIDYSSKSVQEILFQVTDRDLSQKRDEIDQDIAELVFIPSPHLNPYIILIEHGVNSLWVVFGARIPQGATVQSPALNRSELLTRLNALADDTRLRILELLAQEGELNAQEVITRLKLSQSSASRHLSQLSATGYLVEQRHEGAKHYRLNLHRVQDIFDALKGFLDKG